MKQTIRLEIPDAVPSLNNVLRMHWAKQHQLRGQWAWLVKAAVLNGHIHAKVIPRAKVRIERFGKKTLDHDNLVGSCKMLMDRLVKEGFLVDDSPDRVTVEYVQHIGDPHTTILLEAA